MVDNIETIGLAYQQPPQDSLTRFDLGLLAIRILGLYLLVQALTYLSFVPFSIFQSSSTPRPWPAFVSACIPCALSAAVGMFLLFRASIISRWAFPEFTVDRSLSATGHNLQAILFSVIGVWMIASALPDAAGLAANYWLVDRTGQLRQALDWVPRIVPILMQILVGIFLFTRAKGLSAAWHRLRYADISQPPVTGRGK